MPYISNTGEWEYEGDWEHIIPVGPSPYGVFSAAVVKGNRRKKEHVNAILLALRRMERERRDRHEKNIDVPAHELVKAVCPSIIPHQTTAHRLLNQMVKYKVIRKKHDSRPGIMKRVYYQWDPTWGSQISPDYIDDLPDAFNKNIVGDTYRLFIQAESARRVLAKHDLIEVWIAECEQMASAAVVARDDSLAVGVDENKLHNLEWAAQQHEEGKL